MLGIGTKHDISKAIEYLEASAINDNSNSLFTLGMIYLEGEIVKQDRKKGIGYIIKFLLYFQKIIMITF